MPTFDEILEAAQVQMGRKKPQEGYEKYYNLVIENLWIGTGSRKDGEIGLEIECEGSNLFQAPINWWNAHVDNSLRVYHGHSPIEYSLKEPLSRDRLEKAMDYLENKLRQSNSVVVESPRTSVHVHLNCQKMTIKQVINIVLCYLVVEEMLVEWCGQDRVGNLFCLRGKDSHYFIHLLTSAIRSSDYSSVTNNEYRYMSCNVASLRKFGSLEFRSMRGTVDRKLILLWVDILRQIRDAGLSFDNPQEVIRFFDDHGVDGILRCILGPYYHIFERHPEKNKITWDGMRMIREVAYAIPQWEKALPIEEKKAKTKKVTGETILQTYATASTPNFGLGNYFSPQTYQSFIVEEQLQPAPAETPPEFLPDPWYDSEDEEREDED